MDKIYTVDELKAVVSEVAQQFGVNKVALFGSYSYGTPTSKSDIDLLIDKGKIRGLIMFNSFINSLEDRLKKPVDVITYASFDNSLLKDSVKNEVILYEKQ